MKDWINCTIGDIVQFQRGHDLPEQDRISGNIPVVGSAGINGYHNEAKAKGPGVTIGRSGASIGKAFYVPNDFWPHNACLYVKDFKGNNPKAVFFLLKLLDFDYLNSGSAQPSLNRNILHPLKIKFPPLSIQRKIAAILSAYDELIENNNRRIAILEKMAEEIYREWFVRLRFPGHEKVKVVKGVPEGWEVLKLKSLMTTQYGYTASANMEIEGPKFLRITDIVPDVIDWASVPNCKIDEKDVEKYQLIENDVVVARTGATAGFAKRINKYHPKSIFASYLVRLIPIDKNYGIFLGMSIVSNRFKDFINMFLTGAAQPQANAATMSLFPIYKPTLDIILKFNKILEPILDFKEKLVINSLNLVKSRDLLLPRLISGKLDVENLDIAFPPGMKEEMEEAHA